MLRHGVTRALQVAKQIFELGPLPDSYTLVGFSTLDVSSQYRNISPESELYEIGVFISGLSRALV